LVGPEVQKADPSKRKEALLLIAAGLVLGLIAIMLLRPIQSWLEAEPSQLVFRVNLLIGGWFLLAVPIVAICAHMWRIGRQAVVTARYPPPGMAVVKDTIVLRHDPARKRGRVIQWVAALIAIAAVLPPIAMWYLVWVLTRGRAT
jgi:hypothetical protein